MANKKTLERKSTIILYAIFLLIGIWIISIKQWDYIMFKNNSEITSGIKYTATPIEGKNCKELFDSLVDTSCSKIFNFHGGYKYYSVQNDIFIIFDCDQFNPNLIRLGAYQYHSGSFRNKYGLIFRSDYLDIYSPWSNYNATKAVQKIFEKELLSNYVVEIKQISPIRDEKWWFEMEWKCIYMPILSTLIVVILIPVLVTFRRSINAKIWGLNKLN